MTNNRDSQWTEQQDQVLAQTILTIIENNGTQLEGFQAAALLLQQTPAACGFRWNHVVRKRFIVQFGKAKERKAEINQAKKNRFVKKNHASALHPDDVITQVSNLFKLLVAENRQLKAEVVKRDYEIIKLTEVLQKREKA